jgi:spore germination cell wall hydrolase CwlJ-like protein
MGISAAAACLLMAVYFEARSEPIMGQYAVAEVVMNRVADKRWPDTVCGVVKQRRLVKRYGAAGEPVSKKWVCQFSFWCDGAPEVYHNRAAYKQALAIAVGTLADPTNYVDGALFYHADYVRPKWRKRLFAILIIGDHIFYGDQRTAPDYSPVPPRKGAL